MSVDLKEARIALQRFVQGRGRVHIPARADDDDLLIDDALTELEELRTQVPRLEAVSAAEREVLKLGWMWWVNLAGAYRVGGHEIPKRMEIECAWALEHLLNLARVHGAEWRAAVQAELDAMRDAVEAREGAGEGA